MRRFLRRKAYTLVELVLALALTALISSITGAFITYAVRMRSMSDAQTDMYMASLRIHKAIAAELESADSVVVYTKAPTSYSAVPLTEHVLYLNSGMIYYGNKSVAKTSLLPTTNGFDSYNGVTVDSMTFAVVKSAGHLNSDTTDVATLFRCVRVTTTVSKGSWTYTHSSTIRFDEMELNSAQVMVSTTETAYDNTKTRVPIVTDEGKAFPIIRYTIN